MPCPMSQIWVMQNPSWNFYYECHNENSPFDNEQIKADFNALYQAMNGMTLKEMDRVIYPVCTLCRDHEKAGFVEGVKIGIRLSKEITE